MDYHQSIEYLYHQLPMYQNIGKTAFKKGLDNTINFLNILGNPHKALKTIHVAGTNGKGTTCHLLSSALQEAGYYVGLYTSPHLKNFTERIRINGTEIDRTYVANFVSDHLKNIDTINPSFFEITVCLAFDYFHQKKVDIAVIETGLGGRLDSTNVITPELSIITSIGYDHMDMLGDTLEAIAFEKAGIIKPNKPTVTGNIVNGPLKIIKQVCKQRNSQHHDSSSIKLMRNSEGATLIKDNSKYVEKINIRSCRKSIELNLPHAYLALHLLNDVGFKTSSSHLVKGISNVNRNTNLKGRWQILGHNPLKICDIAHNEESLKIVINEIRQLKYSTLHLVLGFVKEKKVEELMTLFPDDSVFYFCLPPVSRALSLDSLSALADKLKLTYSLHPNVNNAMQAAEGDAGRDDLIYIGGSTFVVADVNDL
ncbi:MAG TPA: bifunctional folylpolyglutamate synthase/dihydrofolate synthase [Cyclobacteriaceae bacterium]